MASPLFSLIRDGYEEVVVHGEIAVADSQGVLFQSGEVKGSYPARSLLKPFQFLAAEIPLELWYGASASPRYPACLGSISATQDQVEKLRVWYASSDLRSLMSHLILPPVFPYDDSYRVHLRDAGRNPEAFFHPCFANHMAILESCRNHAWPLADYFSSSHPFHVHLLETLSNELGERLNATVFVVDGCGIPSPVLTIERIAKLYQRLASASDKKPLGAIARLMSMSPEWIGGPGRIDTRLMESNSGRLVAKEGADGLLGISVFPNARFPDGLGIVVKVTTGYVPTYLALALTPLLEALDLKPLTLPTPGHKINYHYIPFEKRSAGWIDISPTLEEEVAVWPGDKKFRRVESYSLEQGHHYGLSSIETTVHVGAHTDAPSHFAKSAASIEQVDVSKYVGPCQVIEVTGTRGGVILPVHLEEAEMIAPRVLFKTGTFPNPKRFNPDFMALSAELIEYLAKRGVILVGIDTPSIDPSDSKELSAHHATVKAEMGILEGIVLDKVYPGLYELVAVPLKIRDGDASPVRALLKPCVR